MPNAKYSPPLQLVQAVELQNVALMKIWRCGHQWVCTSNLEPGKQTFSNWKRWREKMVELQNCSLSLLFVVANVD